jgi:hypothetical protein
MRILSTFEKTNNIMKIKFKLKIKDELLNIIRDQYNPLFEETHYIIREDEFLSDVHFYREYLTKFSPLKFDLSSFKIHYNPLSNLLSQTITVAIHDKLVVEAEIESLIYEVIDFKKDFIIIKDNSDQIFNIEFPQSSLELYQIES